MSLLKTLENIKIKSFDIEIFGLGFVGFPLAVRLADQGVNVIGIDTSPKRIERLQNNSLMDSEFRLKDKFLSCRNNGNLILANTPKESKKSKIGIICVPTPIPSEGTSSDIFVKSAVENFLRFAKTGDLIILESSIEVGTTEKIKEIKPDYIIIFPWNLKTEIMQQLDYVKEWGCKFVMAIPELTIV